MKLLFDENFSPRLVPLLADLFPGSEHVRDIVLPPHIAPRPSGLSASDSAIWAYAQSRGLAIISKDADFRQRSLVLGAPPKVIALLVGNCATATLATVIRSSADLIARFDADPAATFLELP